MLTTKEFLEAYICKVGESAVQLTDNEWDIQKWTARTFKPMGNVFAVCEFDVTPSEAVLALHLKPNSKRRKLSMDEDRILEALHNGWLIEEIRFEKDGRTPAARHYRMGPGLYTYETMKKEGEIRDEELVRKTLQEEIERSQSFLPAQFYENLQQFSVETIDAESWGKERLLKFQHFLIAFLRLRRQQNRIEYKEIGATYYKKIGGSKEFDHYRAFFIGRLEKWLNAPIHEIGIISVGAIVPVYFTGQLIGRFSQYSIGTVHATNDIAVTAEDFKTTATVLWLVENRAVLTRMATEVEFLKEMNAFVVGVDGQIRGAHRKLIQQLCQQGTVQKVMIWLDDDKAGGMIARDLVHLVSHHPYRIIGNEEMIFDTYERYKNWLATVPNAEQEMTLGGTEQW